MPIDKRAQKNWARYDNAYWHYLRFIAAKPNAKKYVLSFADLVFVKNFKGGNAQITEPVATFTRKLKYYQRALLACSRDSAFFLKLSKIPNSDYWRVRQTIVDFAALPAKPAAHIKGVGSSYASALLHFHFPEVVPILDRRVLNGSGVQPLRGEDLLRHYPTLIDYFRRRLRQNRKLALRELDRQLFVKPLSRSRS